MLSIAINILLMIHVVVSLLIVFVVLMQRPKNEGLGAAFGGGMTENLFGAQTTNVLQNFTRWLGGIFLVLTLILSMLYAHQARVNAKTDIQRQLTSLPKLAPVMPMPSASPSSAFTPGSLVPLATATPAVSPVDLGASVPPAPTAVPKSESSPAASAIPTASASPAASPR